LRKFLFGLLFTVLSIHAATANQLPIRIYADKLRGNVNTKITAQGNVLIEFDNVTIKGNNAFYDKEAGILRVWGDVKVTEGETFLKCSSLVYNIKTKKGVLEKVYGRLSPNDYIKADRIERLSEKEWIAYDGEYTPCKNKFCPDWSVGAKKFRVLLGESFIGKWVTFRIKEIPVIATPLLSGPVSRGRKSGFLTPRMGFVSEGGFYYRQPLYLVLGRSADLTLYYEKRFKGGNAKYGEFRYVLSPYSRGDLNYNKINLPNQKSWKLNFNHSFSPSDFFYGSLHGELVNSRNYYKATTSLNIEEKTKIYTKSDATFSKLWKHFLVNGNVVYLNSLDGSTDTIYQKVPNLQVYLMDTSIKNSPLFFSFEGEATYFYRKAGGSSYRISLEPKLKYIKEIKDLKTVQSISYLLNDYQLGGTSRAFKFKNVNTFNKVWNFKGIDFSLTPSFGFKAVNVKSLGNEAIFDLNDKIDESREFFVKGETYLYKEGKEFGRFYFDGGYNFLDKGSWKPLKLGLDFSPKSAVSIQENVEYSFNNGNFKSSNTYLGFPVSFINGNGWVNLYYQRENPQLRYLRWGINVPIGRYLNLSFQQRYDLKLSFDRERDYTLTINRGCWNGRIIYKWVKNFDGSIDYQVSLMINLLRLGSYGYSFTGKKTD